MCLAIRKPVLADCDQLRLNTACSASVSTGFIQGSLSKIQGLFKVFQKISPTIFKVLQLMNNIDLSVKVLLQKC